MKILALLIVLSTVLFACTAAPEDTNKLTGVDVSADVSSENLGGVQNNNIDSTVDNNMKSYSMDEIAMHSTQGDCWLLIDGKVYDVSEYSRHPGGDAILEGCGRDATTLFETRPMGSGTPHSAKAREKMQEFYIGDLV